MERMINGGAANAGKAKATWLKQLDDLLRGEATRAQALRRGEIAISPDVMAIVIICLGLVYGLCMGAYALFQPGGPMWAQTVSTMGKVPLLFGMTLLVTFPSLYVFNALVGSRLSLGSVLRLIIAAMAVMLAVLASFGPIVAFFSVSTTSYEFMLLLNVLVFAVAGFLGLKFLLLTLHRLSRVAGEMELEKATATAAIAQSATPQNVAAHYTNATNAATQNANAQNANAQNAGMPQAPHGVLSPDAYKFNDALPAAQPSVATSNIPMNARQSNVAPANVAPANVAPANVAPANVASMRTAGRAVPGALEREDGAVLGRDVVAVFRIWIIVFGLVGAQMSWVLRPFLGHPGRHFMIFAQRESNFFEAVFAALGRMLGG
jgi:hypothetical protein